MRAELKQLQRLLAQREWSAAELAQQIGCSLPTVYRRLEELAEFVVVVKRRVPRCAPGPVPKRYCLARAAGAP